MRQQLSLGFRIKPWQLQSKPSLVDHANLQPTGFCGPLFCGESPGLCTLSASGRVDEAPFMAAIRSTWALPKTISANAWKRIVNSFSQQRALQLEISHGR